MKFLYREYLRPLPGSSDFSLVRRPVIDVKLSSPQASARCDALVDTGADETVLPMSLAVLLGLKLDTQMTSLAAGISGESLTMHFGDVKFQLEAGHESIEWQTTVGIVDFGSADEELLILGHGGCLDYFTAIFDGEQGELELIPNSMLPR